MQITQRLDPAVLPQFPTSGDEEVDEDASQLNIPIHAFDLIIADECHRGYSTRS
jgi:type I site-specific restriction endonuclease